MRKLCCHKSGRSGFLGLGGSMSARWSKNSFLQRTHRSLPGAAVRCVASCKASHVQFSSYHIVPCALGGIEHFEVYPGEDIEGSAIEPQVLRLTSPHPHLPCPLLPACIAFHASCPAYKYEHHTHPHLPCPLLPVCLPCSCCLPCQMSNQLFVLMK